MKWTAVAYVTVTAFILLLAFIDLIGNAGWGYQWYSIPAGVGMIAVGVLIYKIADRSLRYP
jgi:hypothetical protein